MPLPDRIKNKPILLPGLHFIYSAFWELTTCRQIGMVEGPIPWTAIYQYALAHGIHDSDEIDRLSALVKHMDMRYLTHVRKKNKGATKDPKVQRIGGNDDPVMHMR